MVKGLNNALSPEITGYSAVCAFNTTRFIKRIRQQDCSFGQAIYRRVSYNFYHQKSASVGLKQSYCQRDLPLGSR